MSEGNVTRPERKVPRQQPDAYISQANPVSTTIYPVLPTTKNVRILSIETDITWAVTQPTPLEVILVIDGLTYIFFQNNPVTATPVYATLTGNNSIITFPLSTDWLPYKEFLIEGRSINVGVRVTWAVTQPTPLNCRVKYAKW